MEMEKVCVIGLGYIGLPTAAILATNGFKVRGVDINAKVVDIINKGEIHIKEPDLNTVVEAAVKSKNLVASIIPEKADVFIVSVPTPVAKNKHADLSYVMNACRSIIKYLEKGNLVILESTCPPGTTKSLIEILEQSGLKVGSDLFLAHCPERVLPGKILKEIVSNDRIIGGINDRSAELAKKLYKCFVEGEIYLTDVTTAEFVKLIENTFRDVNIAFANELAMICKQLGINVWEAIELANHHPRVNIHSPGPGVGGHCIAVDPWFLTESCPEIAKLITLSRKINDKMPDETVKLIQEIIPNPAGKIITIFGLAYKANIDDVRESPSIEIVNKLADKGYTLRIYDPYINEYPKLDKYMYDFRKSLEGSHALVILTNHDDFINMDPKIVGKYMESKIVIDTKNCIGHENWKLNGFRTYLLGKGTEENK